MIQSSQKRGTMTTWKARKKELMKNPKFKEAYNALEPEYNLANALIRARISKKLTQEQVAEKAGVSRTVIARLESGSLFCFIWAFLILF